MSSERVLVVGYNRERLRGNDENANQESDNE